MNTSTRIAFAVAILTGLGSVPAAALELGQCTPWKPVLGGVCKARKCLVGEPPAAHLVPETVCRHASLPLRPVLDPRHTVPGTTGGTTVPR